MHDSVTGTLPAAARAVPVREAADVPVQEQPKIAAGTLYRYKKAQLRVDAGVRCRAALVRL